LKKRFLIGQLARFGDCLFATTIARQIKHDYPGSHITWAVADTYKSILELNPYVDSIWVIPVSEGDYYDLNWKNFEKEALQRKQKGEFDEVIFSQILPLNCIRFNGTIRGTILSSYKRPITVPVAPVVRLSATEIENVKLFAARNNLQQYKHVVLFECNPGSNQSKITPELAVQISEKITQNNIDVCFILTSPFKINSGNARIIDACELTFRENAELTKYCSLLIGCSSGITWISTSDCAKRLPMLQLLNHNPVSFAGIHFDFEINGLDNSTVIEMINYDPDIVCNCVQSLLTEDFSKVKKRYHQDYKPGKEHLYAHVKLLLNMNYSLFKILRFVSAYKKYNSRHNNHNIEVNLIGNKELFKIYSNYYKELPRKYIKKNHPEISIHNPLWNSFKYILKKKFNLLPEKTCLNKEFLIVYTYPNFAYSPTTLNLFYELKKHYSVELVIPRPEKTYSLHEIDDPCIRYFDEIGELTIFEHLIKTLKKIKDLFIEPSPRRLYEREIIAYIKKRKNKQIIAVDFMALWCAQMAGRKAHLLSLEINKYYRDVNFDAILSVIIQSEKG